MMYSSKERVQACLRHEEPDRVPADVWAEPQVWNRLMKDFDVSTKNEVCAELASDVRTLEPVYPPDREEQGVRQNMWGERWAKARTPWGTEWEHIEGALVSAASLEELAGFPWPDCDQVDYSVVKAQAKECLDHAVCYGFCDFFERPSLVRGMENFLVDTLINPDWVDYLQKVFLDFYIEDFYRALEASGRTIDIYLALTDLGTQRGLLLGQEVLDRFIFPPLKKLAETVHREGVKLMFHSCGSVREVLPQIIAAGTDILNPIQPAAAGMDPEELKSACGRDLAFHGGVDIQYLLPLKNAGEVKREVRRRNEILGRGGGYIIAPSHNLQQDTPSENIAAMYDTALRYI
ncbi:MAG: hypothetical protein E4H36_14590 [Spirochaetales bacterium]|nr:MAG: hypothetical protein E4H36_14590 [Spirochaetales bacterium]